ncbi:DinB family protein [Flavihumibacter petaseus]|uniref:DinB family protein n=1 Tax=Flavihumibacter petaseus NBRC 106054 TaxID=1220578 RepID=A0A0E9MZF1_9BACT|nr:DinB family protein [Flavihumibacter petaseus]GAO42480.1 hypothetical protein FPE01S_01_14940 [Flavihumibacter petaseus NBRC 106054]
MITPQEFLIELEMEAATTRKMLEKIPDDKFGWKPHKKSMDIKTLSTHLADLAGWPDLILRTEQLDFENMGDYEYPDLNNRAEVLAYFEKQLAVSKAALAKASVADLVPNWTLRSGETIYDVSPKGKVVRMAFSQTVHHRAQLGVFLRLLDIPIPGSYGPSADEMEMEAKAATAG